MFSSESLSSISLATVTPSLVIVGEPNFFSITTLRPLGPSVTFTASARMLTPRRIACRDSSPCTICFAIIRISYQKVRIFLQATPAECLGLHGVRLLATGDQLLTATAALRRFPSWRGQPARRELPLPSSS